MNKLTSTILQNGVKTLQNNDNGTFYHYLDTTDDGTKLYFVMGYTEGYDKGEMYQKEEGGKIYTLCAKIAVNIDDLQCDYNMDWYMPWYVGSGDILDTEMSVDDKTDIEWYNRQAEYILQEMNEGRVEVE